VKWLSCGLICEVITQLGAELREQVADTRAELLKWMFGQTFVILAAVAALHFAK
jgi:hypothetical protein